ncbi:uncharacterized protein LOC130674850 isoform X2 [Microplitis mediator]|uniref:uncharacterized protein LOC130674850 isoform X2 n=1 Tax=Microplitis mediator TaxID=375433 RepID=UPI0025545EAC|nr:uncharacterized protein LOC130674850 isoform X2 [Microplitis mediator]
MPLTFIISQKGNKLLVHEGILYAKKRINKNDISWRCATNSKCNLSIHTDSELRTGNIIGTVPVHDHPGDVAAIQAKAVKNKILKRARKTDDKPAKVVSRSLRGVMSPVAALLPKPASLSRAINRVRAVDNPQLINPASRGDLEIPDELKNTHGGELFLLHDSGGDKKRFMIFTTLRNLNYLSTCDQWLGDGTFRSVPGIFVQLYCIHGFKNGKSLPLIYILAPNKTQRLYENVLAIIRDALPNYKPARMMTDFEDAFVMAFKTKYSGVSLAGCYFHFNQCIWRHIQACGLQKIYDTDISFALNLRLLSALAFVPTADVIKCYELITATDFYDAHAEELDDLLKYFEATWIGKTCHNKKKREKPRFDISM